MEKKLKEPSPYFSLQLIIGLALMILQLFTFSTFYNEFRLSGYRPDYTRFVWYHGAFLFLSLFLCYPDSPRIRYLQIAYCLAYSTIGIFISYEGNSVGIREMGFLVLAGILYWRYEMPRRLAFYISLAIFGLFLILIRIYIMGMEMDVGYCALYLLLIIALGFDRRGTILQNRSMESITTTASDMGLRPNGVPVRQKIVEHLSFVPECKVFTEFEILLMAEYYCANGNATNKELASALSVSDSLIKNSLSNIFKKVPGMHSRVGMLQFVQRQVLSRPLSESEQQEKKSFEKNPDKPIGDLPT